MGEGADEALKVVDLEDGEGEEEAAAAGSSRETRMLPRMPVRVLLAEGDDSTRHVISALLRKCGYRDLGEDFTNMTVEPPDELQFPILGALPDLNMGLPDEEELFQFHEAQFAQLVGSDITGGQNEGISSVHANDEQHQPNRDGWPILDLNAHPPDDEQQAVGEAIPDLNVQATYDDHQPDGEAIPDLNVQPANFDQQPDVDIAFDVIDEQDDFDLNLLVPAQHEEMQQIAAASDGVKAWDILQEKSFNIDLVLTEVDLPLMSGFLLLSTIMEHDASKNIPVIMMSSHDSVSMVFKCMLKGAADFLVKPIRKNELRNLWQHVWRKQLANGGPDVQHIQNEENLAERIEQKIAVTKVDNLNKDGACKDRECSEQESDAQSSCTRSELEAESKQTNNILEYKQPTERQFSIPSHKNGKLSGQTKLRSNNLIPTREDYLSPKKRACLNDNHFEKASRDIEVVHIIDNQQKHDMQREVDTMRTTSTGNDEKGSIPAHQLELSLRRTDYGKLENQEKNDRRMLNHSTSSAFSLYNCRTASTLGNAGDGQLCSTSETQADVENKKGGSAAPSHDITETNRPIRVVPFPVPVQGLTFDGQPFWNGTPVASLFYSQSAPPIWNSKTSMWQESTPQATPVQQKSQQNEPNEMGPKPVQSAEEQSQRSHPSSNGKQLRVEIPKDEARHVSPMTGESGTSTVLDSARNTLSVSGCDSNSNRIPAPTESSNTFQGVPETPSAEGSRHLSQREAALNKFRLKRKDRCFEKKVRYQSRKLLAEQRPRVKGQFVRQDHSIQGS